MERLTSTHLFADMSDVLLLVVVAAIRLLLLLRRDFFSVVSFGVAVDVKDVCGAQCPLEHSVDWAAAGLHHRLQTTPLLLRAQRLQLPLVRLRRTDVRRRHAVLLLLHWTSPVQRLLVAGFGLWLRVLLLLRFLLDSRRVWKKTLMQLLTDRQII